MGALLVFLITTFQPPAPTIGDRVTITFASPTIVAPSADYEIISRSGNSVVIRTFVPHTITINGRAADGPVSVMIPIHSVLKPDDKLEPAPLKPPKPEPWPPLPFVAIAIAAVAAIAAWAAVVMLAKRRVATPRIVMVPSDEFLRRVRTLRPDAPKRWAMLADAVRAYLAAARPDFGAELTTSELLAQIDETERRRPAGWTAAGPAASSDIAGEPPAVQPPSRRRYDGGAVALVETILRQGDLEKFSPWGAAPGDFNEVARRALDIPAWAEPPAVQAEEAA